MGYTFTTQREVRRAFWESAMNVSRKRGRDGDYLTDTRVRFCDYVDHLAREGHISEALAQRVTL